MESLFIQYKKNVWCIKQIDPYDWFCSPGSQIESSYKIKDIA